MKTIHSIEKMHHIYKTNGSSPILITCNDLNEWICKYDKFPKYLFNELIASQFAVIFGINIPETAFIKVKPEHIDTVNHPNLQLNWFEKDCFGSKHLDNTIEIGNSTMAMFNEASFKSNIVNKDDFLKIALFDIWMANEDRNHNNFNMLLHTTPAKSYLFYVIDHVNIFNSNFLDYDISLLTEDDSIIKTDLARILFRKDKNLTSIIHNLIKNFYLYTKECENKLDEILSLVPTSWNIDLKHIRERIIEDLFTDKWKQQCETNFRTLVQSFIINS